MNIFYLDTNPKLAAQALCDKHVNKMVLETAQLLCTAHRVLDGDERADSFGLYKSTHVNHPCSVWARESYSNYYYTWWLYGMLLREYNFRYNKTHKCGNMAANLLVLPNTKNKWIFKDPPLCMPDQYKQANAVESYRAYYKHEKANQSWAKWERGRDKPEWLK